MGRILGQRQMGAVLVIVSDISIEYAAQMSRVEDDEVIETFSTDRADQTFDMAVLPRRMGRDRAIANAHRTHAPPEDVTISAVIVADQPVGSLRLGESLGDLQRQPSRRGMIGNFDMQDSAAPMRQDDERIKTPEPQGRHAQHVDRDDRPCVIAQKGFPALDWPAGPLQYVFRNGGLGQAEAELQEFAMNARRTPERVLGAHPADQPDQFTVDPRPAAARARLAPPPSAPGPVLPDEKQPRQVCEQPSQDKAQTTKDDPPSHMS